MLRFTLFVIISFVFTYNALAKVDSAILARLRANPALKEALVARISNNLSSMNALGFVQKNFEISSPLYDVAARVFFNKLLSQEKEELLAGFLQHSLGRDEGDFAGALELMHLFVASIVSYVDLSKAKRKEALDKRKLINKEIERIASQLSRNGMLLHGLREHSYYNKISAKIPGLRKSKMYKQLKALYEGDNFIENEIALLEAFPKLDTFLPQKIVDDITSYNNSTPLNYIVESAEKN